MVRGGVRFTEEERAEIVEQLAHLKTHPRELLPNRWLLERGMRVVELLAGGRRKRLDDVLTAFEAALESGEPDRIATYREMLRSAVGEVASDLELDLEW